LRSFQRSGKKMEPVRIDTDRADVVSAHSSTTAQSPRSSLDESTSAVTELSTDIEAMNLNSRRYGGVVRGKRRAVAPRFFRSLADYAQAGRRAQRRWLNERLVGALFEAVPEDEVPRSVDVEFSKSAMGRLLEPSNQVYCDKFRRGLETSTAAIPALPLTMPSQLWSLIDRRIRPHIIREFKAECALDVPETVDAADDSMGFLQGLDNLLLAFVETMEVPPARRFEGGLTSVLSHPPVVCDSDRTCDRELQLCLPSAYLRLLVHGVCQFHGLTSTTCGDGDDVTMHISFTKRTRVVPLVSVTRHLATLVGSVYSHS